MFQCHKGDETWDKLEKGPLNLGRTKKSALSLILAILHRITLWRIGQPTQPPPFLPTPVSNAIKNQTDIGCLQALMGIIYHDWAEVQNAYMRYLGAKISGIRLICALIKNCGTPHGKFGTLGTTPSTIPMSTPQKEILCLINETFSYHFNRHSSGIPIRCHFLFKKNSHYPTMTRSPATVVDSCNIQFLPMISKKFQ